MVVFISEVFILINIYFIFYLKIEKSQKVEFINNDESEFLDLKKIVSNENLRSTFLKKTCSFSPTTRKTK